MRQVAVVRRRRRWLERRWNSSADDAHLYAALVA